MELKYCENLKTSISNFKESVKSDLVSDYQLVVLFPSLPLN